MNGYSERERSRQLSARSGSSTSSSRERESSSGSRGCERASSTSTSRDRGSERETLRSEVRYSEEKIESKGNIFKPPGLERYLKVLCVCVKVIIVTLKGHSTLNQTLT